MRTLLMFLFVLHCCAVMAQRGVVHYSRENGLISDVVIDVAYDADGFLWIATDSGIDRFDGQRFIHFRHEPGDPKTICNNEIMRIAYDRKGYVWAATMNGGLIRISTKTLNVRNYFYDKKARNGISDNRATAIFIDPDGETWICPHYRGLDHYDAKKDCFTNYRPTSVYPNLNPRMADLFSAVIADRNNPDLFWCASLDGLFSFHKKTGQWKHFPVNTGSFLDKIRLIGFESAMRCLEQDGKGNLYIGTWGAGLLYFDQYQGVYRRFVYEPAFPPSGWRNSISDIKWRDSRYLYVCASSREFSLFDTKTKEFIRYDESERVIRQPKRMARFGKQIAVAGEGAGIYIHNESLIFGWKERHPFDIQQVVFHPTRNEWFAVNGGNNGNAFFCNEQGKGQQFSLYQGERSDEFFFHEPHYMGKHGYVIVASDRILEFTPQHTFHEVCRYNEVREIQVHDFFPVCSFNDGDSVLWIGTKYGGILRYSFDTDKLAVYRKNAKDPGAGPLHDSWYSSFVRNGDVLYYGYEEGIGAVNLKTLRFFKPDFAELIPREPIRAMVADENGYLWVGTHSRGLWLLDTRKRQILKKITARMGLQTDRVERLLLDNHNRIWALTPHCVAVIDRTTFKIQSLENQNGMSEIYEMRLHNGLLYFSQNNGFVVNNSGCALPKVNEPKPYIQRVRILNDRPFFHNEHTFRFYENNLAFEFGVLDYSNNMNNFVTYRLKGLEQSWRNGNGQDEATYYNIPGGNYVFQVRLIEDGRETMVEYPFHIIPPFWKQWWFVILSALIISVVIWLYIRLRIRRIESTERMRTEFNRQINDMEAKALRAQMNPHFLFNSLNSIRLFILKNEVESASDYIAKFSKLLRMILNHSRQDMITAYDEIQSLKLYLEFERLRFDKGFEFDIQIDGQEVLDCYLPPMIVQPFVENAIWHGLMPRQDDKGHIRISFRKEPGRLFITVADNGIGRQKARENSRKASLKEGSVGLQITKERLRTLTRRTGRLNDFVVEDLVDENGQATGTLIKLYFETEEK